MNTALSPADRARALLARMTLREKAAQLSGIWAYELLTSSAFDDVKAANRMADGIGQITRLGGCTNLPPREAARLGNRIQQYLLDNSRLKIPALIHEESCAGYLTRDADVFPQAIGIAASFNPSLNELMGRLIRAQMLALGARQALAPLLDVTRDPRWGRTEETYGEDPFLVARMGVAYVRGLQGEDMRGGVLATGKHFVGYGASEGGMNWAPAHIAPREMEEVYLYPFEAAVREAGLRSIMPGYHEVDGVPCHTNKALIEGVLRGKWNFDGIVVSDYFGVTEIHDTHGAAEDRENAARMALDAGVDVELPSTDSYGMPLVKAVSEGFVSEDAVDTCVLRVLTVKFALGLFEAPFVDDAAIPRAFHTGETETFALDAARQSITLLKNDGILPLDPVKIRRILVVGPNADSRRNLLGDYSFPAHVESLMDQIEDNFSGTPNPDARYDVQSSLPAMDTALDGIRGQFPDAEIVYAQGCGVMDGDDAGIADAVKAARGADIAIAVVGDKAGLILNCSSGEARDRTTLTLPGRQRELLQALHATGTPTVCVLVHGRPFTLTWEHDHLPAILSAWLPGQGGAQAIAEALAGVFSPAGRLPITFPRSEGQIPIFYATRPSGGKSHWKETYVDESNKPLYPFGHGLSYTSFRYSDLEIPAVCGTDAAFTVGCLVTNTGVVAGDEVVQLYLRDVAARDITRPVKQLAGFARVALSPGETKRVRFTVDTRQLAFLNRQMDFVVEPGELRVMLGSSSDDIRLEGSFALIGGIIQVREKVFAPKVEILQE